MSLSPTCRGLRVEQALFTRARLPRVCFWVPPSFYILHSHTPPSLAPCLTSPCAVEHSSFSHCNGNFLSQLNISAIWLNYFISATRAGKRGRRGVSSEFPLVLLLLIFLCDILALCQLLETISKTLLYTQFSSCFLISLHLCLLMMSHTTSHDFGIWHNISCTALYTGYNNNAFMACAAKSIIKW